MQDNGIGVAYQAVCAALLLWSGLVACPATATELSQQSKLTEQSPSPVVAHREQLKSFGSPVMAGPFTTAPAADFEILGEKVAPGVVRQLHWIASQNYAGMGLRAPLLVANGRYPGKVLCLTGAVHGDEINGVEIVRRIFNDVPVEQLRGTLLGVPIVNTHGFERSYRYLEDRRDLNRNFPGQPDGSSTARIAHSLFSQVITQCDLLVDIHTGTAGHTRLPQIRADLRRENVAPLVGGFGDMAVVVSRPPPSSLRGAAADAGIAAVTLEVGEPGRMQAAFIEEGVRALSGFMSFLNMTPPSAQRRVAQPGGDLYRGLIKVRVPSSGVLMTHVEIGDSVASGDILGTIVDPLRSVGTEIRSPDRGRVLGMAHSQMVVPGVTIFRLGTEEAKVNGRNGSAPAFADGGVDSVANSVAVVATAAQPGAATR